MRERNEGWKFRRTYRKKCKKRLRYKMQEQNPGGKGKRVTQEEMQEENEVQNVGTKSRRKVQEGNTGRNARRE